MNPNQLSAAQSPAPYNVILAGPGAGKSTVIIERAKFLCEQGRHADEFAFTTFTSNGAAVLRRKLNEVGIEPGFCGTLHAMMFGYLRRDDPRWTIVGEEDAADFMQRHVKLLGYKGNAEALKAARQKEDAGDYYEVTDLAALRVIKSYRQFMRSEHLLDYNMVLSEGLKLIDNGTITNRWPILFVDEFQDSSPVDVKIYLALKPDHLFVVGDRKQSIFRFRGSRPENLTDLWNDTRFTKHILEQNYRCAESICTIANEVIELNGDHFEDKTVSATGEEGNVFAHDCSDENHEREFVASVAERWIRAGADPKEIAVLCRTNKLADEMRETLRTQNIPVAEVESDKKPKDWRLLTLIISMISAPSSWAVARLLIREFSKQEGKNVEESEKQLEEWRAQRPGVLPITRFSFPVLPVIINLNADLSRYGISKASHTLLAARIRLFEPSTAEDLLEAMRAQPESILHHGVSCLTVHGAKGQEFRRVIVAGADQFQNSEEDTCLFFVAVTRAKSELAVTCSASRTFKLPSNRIETTRKPAGKYFDIVANFEPKEISA